MIEISLRKIVSIESSGERNTNLSQHTTAVEEDDRNDSDDPHITQNPRQPTLDAPKSNRHQRHPANEPLRSRPSLLVHSDRVDHYALSRSIAIEQDQPDEENRSRGDWDRTGEPA